MAGLQNTRLALFSLAADHYRATQASFMRLFLKALFYLLFCFSPTGDFLPPVPLSARMAF